MESNQEQEDNPARFEIREVTIIHEVDDVELPDELDSHFNSLQEWLFYLCNGEGPAKPVTAYNFGLFESRGHYTLFVVGVNESWVAENHLVTRNDFEPSEMYFPLQKAEYEKMDWDQVFNRVKEQLKDFTGTDFFKASFLSKAQSIKLNGEEFWSNY
jgi:hypothetical protein